MGNLTLSVFEIIFLFLCAAIIGVVIHFFISSRRQFSRMKKEGLKPANGMDEWKLKYLNDMELKNKIIDDLTRRASESEENDSINQIEIEELKIRIKELTETIVDLKSKPQLKETVVNKPGYFEQLQLTRENLADQNSKISQLLEQLDIIKETEEKTDEIKRTNQELTIEINDLRYLLSEKENEIKQIKQKESLSAEMTSMLDTAYNEFNTLQGKILKLEAQLSTFKMTNLEFEDLKESHYKMSRELEEAKNKVTQFKEQNQQLQTELEKTEDKLSEANMQRQQLQKKVAYLEELTNDLQQMADSNKNLESQLKKIGELESMLNVVSEERNILKDKQHRGL